MFRNSWYGLWRCKYNVWKTQTCLTWIFDFPKSNIYSICHRGLLHLQVLKKFLRENRGHSRPEIDNGKRWRKSEADCLEKWSSLIGLFWGLDLIDDFDSLEETESRNEASASQCQRGERGAFRRATRLSLLPFYPCSCIWKLASISFVPGKIVR